MKAFILLSLACLAVSLPIYAGTRQADLDLALADPTSLPAPTAAAPTAATPTAATPSNAVLFQKRRVKSLIPILLGDRPSRRGASKTLSKEPSKILSEEPSKNPTNLPAPTAATPNNAVLFQKRGVGVMLSRPKRRPSRVAPSKTLSEEPSKEPTSLPAPTTATPNNAVLFRRRGPGVIAAILLGGYLPRRYASKTLSKEPSKILSEKPSKDPTSLPAPTAATPSNTALFQKRGVGVMLASWFSRLPPRRCASKTLSEEPSKDPTSLPAPTAATPSNATLFRKRGVGFMLAALLNRHPSWRRASKTLSKEPSKEPDTKP